MEYPHIYFSLRYLTRVFGGALEWDSIFFAVVKNRVARQVFLLRLLDGKEELDWFKVFECWLLDFADKC